jgi:aminoglycoside phosphotransferase (APT) family kinase protein
MSIQPILRWAAGQVGAGARIVAVQGLRGGAAPWRLGIHHAGRTLEVVLRTVHPDRRPQLATEAAALALAEDRRLAAPRLLAVDLDGAAAGQPALLMTALPGTSQIPSVAPPGRLRALAAVVAALHTVAAAPSPDLPPRVRPLADVDFAAQRRTTGSSALLDAAERLSRLPPPEGPTVFIHGDLWQGNTVWDGERCAGMVDWDAAGMGDPGIDLGTLRLDAALLFGPPAAAEFLEEWRQTVGQAIETMAYRDLVAALTTPTDMAEWVPVAHDHGRVDLDAKTLNHRRDGFLHAALDQLP